MAVIELKTTIHAPHERCRLPKPRCARDQPRLAIRHCVHEEAHWSDTSGGLAANTQTGIQDYFIAKYDSTGTLS
jgi:hypothetical protein